MIEDRIKNLKITEYEPVPHFLGLLVLIAVWSGLIYCLINKIF